MFSIPASFFLLNSYSDSILSSNDKLFFLRASEVDLFRPLIKDKLSQLYLESNNFLSVFVNIGKNREIILSQKKSGESVAIASLSKLVTAMVAIDNYEFDDLIKVKDDAFKISSPAIDLTSGEIFTMGNLLKIMLIESNNTAAEAIAAKMGRSKFVSLMNKKADGLGMDHTSFFNPSGLDDGNKNISTPEDLKKLVISILNDYPLIAEILSMSEAYVKNESGVMHDIKNTNILLKENSIYLWGKTGYTKEANGCIILVLKDYAEADSDNYIINIITGADDRFREARKLEEWLKDSFIW